MICIIALKMDNATYYLHKKAMPELDSTGIVY